jgi:hypothetical protein
MHPGPDCGRREPYKTARNEVLASLDHRGKRNLSPGKGLRRAWAYAGGRIDPLPAPPTTERNHVISTPGFFHPSGRQGH